MPKVQGRLQKKRWYLRWLLKNEWHHSLGGEEKIRANLSSRYSKGMSKTERYDYGKVSVNAFGAVW